MCIYVYMYTYIILMCICMHVYISKYMHTYIPIARLNPNSQIPICNVRADTQQPRPHIHEHLHTHRSNLETVAASWRRSHVDNFELATFAVSAVDFQKLAGHIYVYTCIYVHIITYACICICIYTCIYI